MTNFMHTRFLLCRASMHRVLFPGIVGLGEDNWTSAFSLVKEPPSPSWTTDSIKPTSQELWTVHSLNHAVMPCQDLPGGIYASAMEVVRRDGQLEALFWRASSKGYVLTGY